MHPFNNIFTMQRRWKVVKIRYYMKVIRCRKLSLVCFHLCKKMMRRNLTLFIFAFMLIKNISISLNKELIEEVTSCTDGRTAGMTLGRKEMFSLMFQCGKCKSRQKSKMNSHVPTILTIINLWPIFSQLYTPTHLMPRLF